MRIYERNQMEISSRTGQ